MIFSLLGVFSCPTVCWDNSHPEFPGIPSDLGVGLVLVRRVNPETELGEIWVKSMPGIPSKMNRAGNFSLGHVLWPLISSQGF